MKKVIGLTFAALLIIGIAGGGTWAFFSDSEISQNNTLTAGTLDLQVGATDPCTESIDVGPNLKPGDSGNAADWTVSNLGSVTGTLSIDMGSITNYENTRIEPEEAAGDTTTGATEGELGDFVDMAIWLDVNQSGSWDSGDMYLKSDGSVVSWVSGSSVPSGAYDDINNYDSVSWDSAGSSVQNPTATWSGTNRLAMISAVINSIGSISPSLVGSWTGETDFGTNGLNYTPGAGSNRIALVTITAESNSNPVANINQVTLGGQTLTAIESSDGIVVGSAGSFHNLIWLGYLNETSIGSMSGNTLNITWDTAPTNSPPIMVQAATYQNVDQTTPIADSASNTNIAASSIQAGDVSVGTYDSLVYLTTCGQPSDHSAPGGYTEQIEQDGPAFSHSNASVQMDPIGMMPALSGGSALDFMVEYDFPSDVNDNRTQSDSCVFNIIFTLEQV